MPRDRMMLSQRHNHVVNVLSVRIPGVVEVTAIRTSQLCHALQRQVVRASALPTLQLLLPGVGNTPHITIGLARLADIAGESLDSAIAVVPSFCCHALAKRCHTCIIGQHAC